MSNRVCDEVEVQRVPPGNRERVRVRVRVRVRERKRDIHRNADTFFIIIF